MCEINYCKVFVLFSGDVAMIEQLRWIACMSRKLLPIEFVYIVIKDMRQLSESSNRVNLPRASCVATMAGLFFRKGDYIKLKS
jgi:hypothetical protein